MTYLLVSRLLLAFPAVSILAFKPFPGYNAHALDPNHLIHGFSPCYIELALFSETQEFQIPPQIPVTVSFSKTIQPNLTHIDERTFFAARWTAFPESIAWLCFYFLSHKPRTSIPAIHGCGDKLN
jgi:hypothetical protein